MLKDQRFIIERDIPIEVAGLFILVAVIAAGFAFYGLRKGGRSGENTIRITAAVLCGLGLLVSGYIAYKAVIVSEPFQCAGGGGGCALVEQSKYARPFLDIHLSIWGLIGYTTILAATIWRGDNARLLAFALSAFGFGVSLVLRYLELWEIHAACQWCWASAVLMTMLLVVNSCRLVGSYGRDEEDPELPLDDSDSPDSGPAKATA